MAEPIIFISRFGVRYGKAVEVASVFEGVAAAIGTTRPRTALYAAYIDATASELRIVHAFPDGPAMTLHFAGSAERASSIADLVEYRGFDVYGAAPGQAVDQLRREATTARVALETYPNGIGGFMRAPA